MLPYLTHLTGVSEFHCEFDVAASAELAFFCVCQYKQFLLDGGNGW